MKGRVLYINNLNLIISLAKLTWDLKTKKWCQWTKR